MMSDMEKAIRVDALCSQVSAWVEQNPDHMHLIMNAAAFGMSKAMDSMNLRRARADQAMLAALSLADQKRLTPDLRTALCQRIATAINEGSASPVERAFLAKANGKDA